MLHMGNDVFSWLGNRESFICSVTTGESCDEHGIDIQVWNGDEASDTVKERTESGLPRIPKVPATLRNSQNIKLPQWIQPSVVSVVTSRIRWATLMLDGWTRDFQHTRGS